MLQEETFEVEHFSSYQEENKYSEKHSYDESARKMRKTLQRGKKNAIHKNSCDNLRISLKF